MVYKPPVPGRRRVLTEMDESLIAFLDRQARARTISRASYIRQLIIDDLKRQEGQLV